MIKKIDNQFACSRMMLPEHREHLRAQRLQLENYDFPILDEQQYELFERTIIQSLNLGLGIQVTLFADEQFLTLEGVVKNINLLSGQITLLSKDGRKAVTIKNITHIKEM
ncbi:MAG: YolD-like family protein [Bacillota bacterium]|nr:YolD-like family protein [Bacillota bacterium]